MGAEAAIRLGSPPAQEHDPKDGRSTRFSAVAEIVRLYHDVERALVQTRDTELAELAAAAREGEQALEEWARRIEAFRSFKRRFEAGIHPADEPRRARTPLAATPPTAALDAPGPLPFLWEALAFIFGFAVSFLIT
jgi:hypothetical protein